MTAGNTAEVTSLLGLNPLVLVPGWLVSPGCFAVVCQDFVFYALFSLGGIQVPILAQMPCTTK